MVPQNRKNSREPSPVISQLALDAEAAEEYSGYQPLAHSINVATSCPSTERASSPDSEYLEARRCSQALTEATISLLNGPKMNKSSSTESLASAKPVKRDLSEERKVHHVRVELQQHGLFINHSVVPLSDQIDIYAAHPEVQEAVDKVLNKSVPHQLMTTGEAEQIIRRVDWMATQPTKLLVDKVWPLIFRLKLLRETQESASDSRTWYQDGLFALLLAPFRYQATTPLESRNNKSTSGHILSLADSRPAVCYGLSDNAFTAEQDSMLQPILHYAFIQKPNHFSFFIVEAKGSEGNMVESENQALRNTSTLVWASRQIQGIAGKRDLQRTGADTDNIIFSICMTSVATRLFVTWALVEDGEGGTKELGYHMTRLRQYSMVDVGDLIALRKDIENIMDWGLSTRKQWILDMLPGISYEKVKIWKLGNGDLSNGELPGQDEMQIDAVRPA
ncbi:MAG: hypothetical protein Q9166_002301 [cf. Caloplaca sp. 2 TL-2023]